MKIQWSVGIVASLEEGEKEMQGQCICAAL
jgi:hypothetical protein